METIKTKSVIDEDQHLRIDMEVSLPPGPVEVVVVVSPETGSSPTERDLEAARQRFLTAAGCGESGDPLSSRRVDEILYGKTPWRGPSLLTLVVGLPTSINPIKNMEPSRTAFLELLSILFGFSIPLTMLSTKLSPSSATIPTTRQLYGSG
jgi:hypothetical protein